MDLIGQQRAGAMPNHHVLFDTGAIFVDVDGFVRENTSTRSSESCGASLDTSSTRIPTYHREIHTR